MTCEICGVERNQPKPTKIVGRTPAGVRISCHTLECRHAWHLVVNGGAPYACTCPKDTAPETEEQT